MHTGLHCNVDYVADLNISDGKILYLYGVWEAVSPSGVVVDSEPLTQFSDGQYNLDVVTGFVVEEIGTYKLNAGIFYVGQEYNETEGAWKTTSSGQCLYETSRDLVVVTYPNPPVEDILLIIQQLYEQWQNSL
jgi:hypothetical protein